MCFGAEPFLRAIWKRVFISYDHDNDQAFYNEFCRVFSEECETVADVSLSRASDSDDTEYIIRRIREHHITGASYTIVLCGRETQRRKHVDWEIKAALDENHGLIGINLPTNPLNSNNKYSVPDRLLDNIESGYAIWMSWTDLINGGPNQLQHAIAAANKRSSELIDNSRALRQSNG